MTSRLGPVRIAFVVASALACDGLLDITQLNGSSGDGGAGTPVVLGDASLGIDNSPSLDGSSGASASPEVANALDASDEPDVAADADGDEGAGCFPRPTGLVSWWRAEGNAADSVGPNDGTPTNVTFVPGVVGQAFQFPGGPVGGDIVAGAVGLPTGGADRTIEMWVRLDARYEADPPVFVEGSFFGYGGWGTSNGVYELLVFAAGAASIPTDSLGFSQWGQFLRSSTLTENVWHHVAATWASGTLTIYVDGSLAVSDRTSFALATSEGGTVCMGGLPTSVLADASSQHWLMGAVDEVSVYTRALAPSEVQGIFRAGSSGKCQ